MSAERQISSNYTKQGVVSLKILRSYLHQIGGNSLKRGRSGVARDARGSGRMSANLQAILAYSGATAVVLLAVFHAVLLWERLWDLSIFRPDVALRWGSAGALLGGALWLRSRGVSLLRGRNAGVFWMLVLLLHFIEPSAFTGNLVAPHEQPGNTALVLILPAFVGVCIGLILRVHRRRQPGNALISREPVTVYRRWLRPVRRRMPAGHSSRLYSRPPPVR